MFFNKTHALCVNSERSNALDEMASNTACSLFAANEGRASFFERKKSDEVTAFTNDRFLSRQEIFIRRDYYLRSG